MKPIDWVFAGILGSFLIVYIPLFSWMIYKDYKDKQRRKHQQVMDQIPCLCGHAKWIHWSRPNTNNGNAKCQDLNCDYPCKCNTYRMDNLAYLEKVERVEHEDA